jgi:hypothetical protein
MIKRLRTDLGAENVPVLIGEVIPGHGNHDVVNVALAETAKNTPTAALVSSANLGKNNSTMILLITARLVNVMPRCF